MATMPDFMFLPRLKSSLLIGPQRVQLSESSISNVEHELLIAFFLLLLIFFILLLIFFILLFIFFILLIFHFRFYFLFWSLLLCKYTTTTNYKDIKKKLSRVKEGKNEEKTSFLFVSQFSNIYSTSIKKQDLTDLILHFQSPTWS